MRCALNVVVVALVGAAAGSTLDDGGMPIANPELAELRTAQATVKHAQKDLDGLIQDTRANPNPKAAQKKAAKLDLGESLMKEDDAMGNPLEDTDASVQAEAMA